MSGPYGIGALTYYEAGFSPLPALGKLLKVSKASGRHPEPNKEQIERWSKSYGPFNIALRLPKDVIALDIDEYKDDLTKLKILEEKLGVLPETWNSDSRAGKGGKLLYRVPPDIKWQSNINGITIVQRTHRYVMAFPSHNKESNSRYEWYRGLNGSLVLDNVIPSVDDLTFLPNEWIVELKKSDTVQAWSSTVGINNDDLDLFNDGEPCGYMELLTEFCLERLKNSASVHDTGSSIIALILTAATDGHAGVQYALDEISETFCMSNRARDLVTEWNNLLSWHLGQVEQEDISEVDSCSLTVRFTPSERVALVHDFGTFLTKSRAAGIPDTQAVRLMYGRNRR